jgi:hypothetical protein
MLRGLSTSASNAVWLLLAVALFSVLAFWSRRRAPALHEGVASLVQSRSFWLPASFAVLVGFAALLAINVAFPGYLDHAEPNIASVSWLVLKGAPLYHAIDAPERYSLLYGPTTYLPYTAALALGGGSAASLKGAVLVADVVMIYFLWRAYRSQLAPAPALLVTVFVLLFMHALRPNHYFFQVRADVLCLSAIAVALFGASQRSGWAGPVALAIGSAFVADTKATGFAYLLPLFAAFYGLRGLRLSALVALAAMALAGLPFLLPNVSLPQYLDWLHRATGHPQARDDLVATLRAWPILVFPLVLIAGPVPLRNPKFIEFVRARRLTLLALLVALAFATFSSSRIGAGSHHLLPLLPTLAYEYLLLHRALGGEFAARNPFAFRYVWACMALVLLIRIGGGFAEVLSPWRDWKRAARVSDEVRSLAGGYRHPGVGWGDALDDVTYYRPEAVFAAGRLLVDEVALSDMDLDKIPVPSSTIQAIDTCFIDAWLIPKNEEPFSMSNSFSTYYPKLVPPPRPLFGAAFRTAFARRYSKRGSGEFFDLWVCDTAAAGTGS